MKKRSLPFWHNGVGLPVGDSDTKCLMSEREHAAAVIAALPQQHQLLRHCRVERHRLVKLRLG
jgi:hypothetical protein